MTIDHCLQICLFNGQITQPALDRVADYLEHQQASISFELSKCLISQFNSNSTLISSGKDFFTRIRQVDASELITRFIGKDLDYLLPILKADQRFAISLIDSITEYSDFAEGLFESLEAGNFLVERIKIQLLCRSGKLKQAFEISKNLAPEILSVQEIYDFLKIVREFDAWEIEIDLILRLKELESESYSTHLKLSLFDAFTRAKRYAQSIELGQELLEISPSELGGIANWELVFRNTIVACIERSIVDEEALEVAARLISSHVAHASGFTIKARIIPDIYIRLGRYREAFEATIDAIEVAKQIPSTDYAGLFFNLTTRLGNGFDINDYRVTELRENDFFHIAETDQWYRLGGDAIFGALTIFNDSQKYPELLGKNTGSTIDLSSQFSAIQKVQTIDAVCSTELFIFDHIVSTTNLLAGQDMLPGVTAFSIPEVDGEVNAEALLGMLKEITGQSSDFFNFYCDNPIPFAALSANQGGFIAAIGKIINEGRGYINHSSGVTSELEEQIGLAKSAIHDGELIYLDATSAIFLSESGMLPKLLSLIPNIRIPGSVVDLLNEVLKAHNEHLQSDGSLAVTEDRIIFNEANEHQLSDVGSILRDAINTIETEPFRIDLISDTHKSDKFSESKIEACYTDAALLARRDDGLVLTDDYLYLKMSQVEHQYKDFRYFSSIAFMCALVEIGDISASQYLKYFGLCASYRFRFLPVNAELVESAVLGAGLVKELNIGNLESLRLPLLLSEDYGADMDTCIRVIYQFVFRVVTDQTLTDQICGNILLQFVSLLPDRFRGHAETRLLEKTCSDGLDRLHKNAPDIFGPEYVRKRLKILSDTIDIFN